MSETPVLHQDENKPLPPLTRSEAIALCAAVRDVLPRSTVRDDMVSAWAALDRIEAEFRARSSVSRPLEETATDNGSFNCICFAAEGEGHLPSCLVANMRAPDANACTCPKNGHGHASWCRFAGQTASASEPLEQRPAQTPTRCPETFTQDITARCALAEGHEGPHKWPPSEPPKETTPPCEVCADMGISDGAICHASHDQRVPLESRASGDTLASTPEARYWQDHYRVTHQRLEEAERRAEETRQHYVEDYDVLQGRIARLTAEKQALIDGKVWRTTEGSYPACPAGVWLADGVHGFSGPYLKHFPTADEALSAYLTPSDTGGSKNG